MSSTELATRLGVSQQTVPDLERSELHDTIELETLRRAADALDCDLAYFLLPRKSLDEAVKAQARRKAARYLGRVAHHSRLEDQTVSDDDAAAQLDLPAHGLRLQPGSSTAGGSGLNPTRLGDGSPRPDR